MGILNELYFGNITPGERDEPSSPAYRSCRDALNSLEEELFSRLTGEEQELFRQYSNEASRLNAITDEDAFLYGFQLGARMIAAALFSP